MAKFQSTKTYGTDRGLSCCFRQWRANHSHCSTLHGYSLGFKFIFESETLDEKNWCFDFGGMKPIKQWLDYMFDHTILVAEDDPALEFFKSMAAFSTKERFNGSTDHIGYQEPTPYELGRICDLRIVPGVGCELTAKMVYDKTVEFLEQMKTGELGRYAVNPDVRLVSVECFEHGSNSALYVGDHQVNVTTVEVGDDSWEPSEEALESLKEAVKQANTKAGIYDPTSLLGDFFNAQKVPEPAKPAQQLDLLFDALMGKSPTAKQDVDDIKYFTNKLLKALITTKLR